LNIQYFFQLASKLKRQEGFDYGKSIVKTDHDAL